MLHLQFNDGRPIPEDWHTEAVLEITERFGASSFETQTIEGRWFQSPDLTKNRRWMKDFKKSWKDKLQQLELWMVSFQIDVEEECA